MSQVYAMKEDGTTAVLERITCKNEDKELQTLIARNLDILPGAQINPEEKLRWLLIKREMPVSNPASGESAWSLDFLVVDQFHYPTLVECKRRNDIRSRREVIGQMVEYAANGRHYWSASEMRSHAQTTAGGEAELNGKLVELTASPDPDAETFFASVEQNLRQSKMRLIFFLEDSPFELRSMVEFLNGQMKDTEVLIVEARQYAHDHARIVVPHLFGFTEEARVAKRDSRADVARSSLGKGEATFWDRLASSALSDECKSGIRQFIAEASHIPGCTTTWQKSFLISFPSLSPRSILFGVRQDGSLEIYLERWRARDDQPLSKLQCEAKSLGFQKLEQILSFTQQELEEMHYPQRAATRWVEKSSELLNLIGTIGSLACRQETADAQQDEMGTLQDA